MTTNVASRPGGRPRSPEADRAILDATLRLLVEQGYDGMSIEGIAAAAGVGKTTIYRRYPTKRDVVIAAVSSLAAEVEIPPDSGDTRGDLLALLRSSFRVFGTGGIGFPMLGTLLVRERDDPELLARFREQVLRPRIAVVLATLRRGVERGEVRADAPLEPLIQALAGSMFAHHVIGGEVDEAWLRTVVDALWPAIAAPGGQGPVRDDPPTSGTLDG